MTFVRHGTSCQIVVTESVVAEPDLELIPQLANGTPLHKAEMLRASSPTEIHLDYDGIDTDMGCSGDWRGEDS